MFGIYLLDPLAERREMRVREVELLLPSRGPALLLLFVLRFPASPHGGHDLPQVGNQFEKLVLRMLPENGYVHPSFLWPRMKTASTISTYLASIGSRGGKAKSAAKTAAVRANGAKGGRPTDKERKARTEAEAKAKLRPIVKREVEEA